jgi:hypothetical protein
MGSDFRAPGSILFIPSGRGGTSKLSNLPRSGVMNANQNSGTVSTPQNSGEMMSTYCSGQDDLKKKPLQQTTCIYHMIKRIKRFVVLLKQKLSISQLAFAKLLSNNAGQHSPHSYHIT